MKNMFMGIGDWPIPNPQSPIPNPHSCLFSKLFNIFSNNIL